MAPATPTTAAPSANKWWVLLAVGVGTFMSALDGSVVNTVLPLITGSFRTDVARIEWVVTVYLLVVSGLLLSFGRLGDMRGQKPFYLAGFGIFVAGSALCGAAPSAEALIGFRAVQAIGAAMLFANGPAILTKSFPAAQRGQALGMQATMTYLGLATGPLLGGWLTAQFSWRAVFYINVPVGLLALALSARFVPREIPAGRAERFDIAGAATFTLGLVALLLGLNQGHAWGWTSAGVLGALVVAVAFLAIFITIERRAESPMLDLRLFHSRVFSLATTAAVLNYLAVYSVLFLLPFYLIDGRQLGPAQAGLVLTAQPIVMAIVAPFSGTLSDRVGARLPATLGMLVMAGGLWLLGQSGPQTGLESIVLGLAIIGLGVGLFTSPNNNAMMGAAPRTRQGIAAGVLASARNVGMVLGIGVAGAVFTTVLSGQQGAPDALIQAVDAGLLVAAGISVLGALASAVRSGR